MGIKPSELVTIVDDFDGKSEFQTDTPDDFKLMFGWDSKWRKAYVSEANRAKIEKFLASLIENAEVAPSTQSKPIKQSRATGSGASQRDDREAVRGWAHANNITDRKTGKPVGKVGRISADVFAQYDEK